jgi:peroxiredoxin
VSGEAMMRLRIKQLPALFMSLLAMVSISVAATPPEETLYDFDGQPHLLQEYLGQGKWLVVTVWASDCAVCNREIPELVAFHNAYHQKNATVLGISVDGRKGKPQAQAFIERHRVSFPNLLDDGHAFKAIYRRATGRSWFGGTPMNLVYTPDGVLAARRIGSLAKAEIEAFIREQRKD